MELKIIEKSKGSLKLEIVGEDHTLCNSLKDELLTDKTIKIASYRIEHPLTSNPVFLIEGDDPLKSIEAAAKKLSKFYKELEGTFSKLK